MIPPQVRSFAVPADLAGERLDVALARLTGDLSRARVQRLVEAGRVTVSGRKARASARLRGGEEIRVDVPLPEPDAAVAQDLPLSVLHEDPDLLVLDKAAGMVVHPARGAPHSTVVNALLFRLRRGADAGPPRLGLVHRLDRDTSGCLAVARTEAALASLQAQFKARTVEKVYVAICHGVPAAGRADTPYGRHPRDRTRFTGRVRSGRRAVTEWKVLEAFPGAALLEVRLQTGRTHQIRVHLAEAGHPLLADAVYGGRRREARLPASAPARLAAEALGRQALHASRLSLDHPRSGKRMRFEAPLPADLSRALALLRAGRVAAGGNR